MTKTTGDTAMRTAASAIAVALRDGARATPSFLRGGAERFARSAETAPIGLLARLLLAFSFLSMAVPALDLGVARWFAVAGHGFPLQHDAGLKLLRWSQSAITGVLLAATLASLYVAALGLSSRWVMRPHKALFLIAVYATGPGLLVNGVLKNLFGRVRPRELLEFGGTLDFTGPWQLVGACSGNCSFTSGEAASAAAMLAVALIVPKPARIVVAVPLAVLAVLFSLNRIAFGGHFLSDVVLSWLLVGIVMLLIRAPIFTAADRIDRAVTGIGIPAWRFAGTRLARLDRLARLAPIWALASSLIPDRRRAPLRP